MKPSILENRTANALCFYLSKTLLMLAGWKIKGVMPDSRKFVLIAEPHSSNWDFFFFLLVVFHFRIPVHWMGKHTLFKPPYSRILERLGGIAVNRGIKENTVGATVDAFRHQRKLVVTLAPSGTRRNTAQWKTGFYHIARKAGVPIALGYIDYKNRTAGIGPLVYPSHDMPRDMAIIRGFYLRFTGRS